MALPHDEEIQTELFRLLADAPHGRMHCQDIYEELARRFPCLTEDEKNVPYRNSVLVLVGWRSGELHISTVRVCNRLKTRRT
jgi:hypothetical protein